MNSSSINKNIDCTNAPKNYKATVEEVEDEDEIRMREKPKAKGPGILEDAEQRNNDSQSKAPTQPRPANLQSMTHKIHPMVELELKERPRPMGKAECFLRRIRETRKNAMDVLRKWTSKDRHDEVTVFLLQSLLAAPYDQALETLRDLKQPRHYISNLGGQHSLHLPITFQTTDTNASFSENALVDCGATGLYMDREFAQSLNLNLQTLSHPIPVYNVDKTPNKCGPIRQVITLRVKVGDHVETATFAVTNTGRDKVILGHSWLHRHNPNVDWKAGKLFFNRCPTQCSFPQTWENEDEEIVCDVEYTQDELIRELEAEEDEVPEAERENLEEGERLMMLPESIDHFICAKATISQQIAEKEAKRLAARKKEYPVPDRYVKDFGPTFEKDEFDELPARTKWDHAIELKEDSTPFTSKIYPLSKDEQQELDGFIEEHLRSGRIRPSKAQ